MTVKPHLEYVNPSVVDLCLAEPEMPRFTWFLVEISNYTGGLRGRRFEFGPHDAARRRDPTTWLELVEDSPIPSRPYQERRIHVAPEGLPQP